MVRGSTPSGRSPSRSLRASGGGPLVLAFRWRWPPVSPRERRWSADGGAGVVGGVGLSARAEVVRDRARRQVHGPGSLRASGGGPSHALVEMPAGRVSPRERRWSDPRPHDLLGGGGLSARAEVVRPASTSAAPAPGSLRASGGGPAAAPAGPSSTRVSPRERRWSGLRPDRRPQARGLSARAEVVRASTRTARRRRWSLRASGGGPVDGAPVQCHGKVSPRERRWSGAVGPQVPAAPGLSARAEVVRRRPGAPPPCRGSLRASGGGPVTGVAEAAQPAVSPRERRWSAGS